MSLLQTPFNLQVLFELSDETLTCGNSSLLIKCIIIFSLKLMYAEKQVKIYLFKRCTTSHFNNIFTNECYQNVLGTVGIAYICHKNEIKSPKLLKMK